MQPVQLLPSAKLSPADFTRLLYPFALQSEKKTGISAVALLTQGAWESGWNKASPGWMFFGIKDTDGINGNEQLLTTTEYSRSANAQFPQIQSITPVVRNGQKWFKYVIKDYFRRYNTPEESFTDHANFFLNNPRYAKALLVKGSPDLFFEAIAKAVYATDPDYAANLKKISAIIKANIPK